MTTPPTSAEAFINLINDPAFTREQKEYLAGLMAGIAERTRFPFVGVTPTARSGANPSGNDPNQAAPALFHGTPVDELCKQERWKYQEHGLDCWDKILAHAEANRFPDEENTFRFRYYGLFYVAPAQNSFMLRCRIPAGELTAAQFRGLADLADEFGNRQAQLTTRANIQIREIAPKHIVQVLMRLQSLGLTSKGAGVDNIRNITASPTAGIDPQEFIDTRPYAHALHHYILNHRNLYDLPRKFNVAFDGGGSINVLADTNDIGFRAVRITEEHLRHAPNPSPPPTPGVYFRVLLCGITGHKQLAYDAGILVAPQECVAVAAAMIRVFAEHGDRTNRQKARLKYLLDRWGLDRFLEETQKRLAFPLRRWPVEHCTPPPPPVPQAHIGVYRQKQKGLNYIGVLVPVGLMTSRQMRRLADLAIYYGSGELRLTPWQNLLLINIPDAYVETVKRALVRIGFHYEASHLLGGLVACTGNTGCKYAATNTKAHALTVGRHLAATVQLDQPLNIHFTGCPHSCAQHYIGDIGLQGVKVTLNGESLEAYNIVLGGGAGPQAGIAKQVFSGILASEVPALLERILRVYLERRHGSESFAEFTRRYDVRQLQEMFSP
ncbi:MAG: NirA family protein [Verrucomicrobiota bacterium]|nr:NirA family protein [Limisphaera sp.]MDW8382472.1 NirA family protein [Verrucomicrobiota bacterium]